MIKKFGYRSVYQVAAALFLIGAVLSALTPNIYCMLVSFGVILGKLFIANSSGGFTRQGPYFVLMSH